MFRFILPLIFSSLFIGAHFLRDGNLLLLLLFAGAPLLLFIRRRWVLYVIQTVCYVSTLIWLDTTLEFIQERILTGESWTRLVIILGSVAFFTLFSGLLMNAEGMRERYPSTVETLSSTSS